MLERNFYISKIIQNQKDYSENYLILRNTELMFEKIKWSKILNNTDTVDDLVRNIRKQLLI